MKEKKQIKISLKTAIILILALILVVIVGIFIYNKINTFSYRNGNSITTYSNLRINTRRGKDVEYDIKTAFYSGPLDCIENTFVSSYSELETYLSHFGEEVTIDDKNVLEIFNKDFFMNNTIAIAVEDINKEYNRIDSVKVDGTEVNINIDHTNSFRSMLSPTVYFNFIILDNNIKSARFNITIKKVTKEDTKEIEGIYKPIIYLYPTQDMEVSVELGYNEKITVSYPKYLSGWNVLAKTDGTIIDLATGRNLYALYYESENIVGFKVEKEGFVIKGEDTISFLEEKLAILGLTEREAEEFIVYWLPKLEANKYNYIRFATTDEVNANMPLKINPSPDTTIRVLMIYKGLEEPIDVYEQQLKIPNRTGFVAVEWGGTEIK